MKNFLTGLATGLAVGYLTAPRSGKETRNQLTEAANKQTKGLKDQWNKTTAQVNKLVDEVKEQSGLFKSEPNLFADLKSDNLDRYKNEAQRTKEEVKDKYNAKVDNMADAAKAGVNKAEQALKQ